MTGTVETTALADAARQSIEAQCSRLVTAFAYFVDSRRYAELVDLFAADGSFARPGVEAIGAQGIARWLDSRPTANVTRHVCAASLFENVGPEVAKAITYVTVFQGEGTDGEMTEIDGPAGVAQYHDTFVLTAGGWRIATRVVEPVFVVRK